MLAILDSIVIVYTKERGRLELTPEQWVSRSLNIFIHREDGPAVEWTEGTKEWYLNNKLHRINSPAREYSNGDKHWHLNGKRHRIDGPAIEYNDGGMSWYIDGEFYLASQYNQIIEETKSLPLELRLTDPRWWVRELK